MGTHWAAIAPVYYNQLLPAGFTLPAGLTLPHRFADRVTLAEIPAWVTSEDVLNCLSYSSRNKLKGGARYCISVDYEADAFGTPDKEDPSRSIQDTKFDLIKYVNFAIW